MLFITKILLKSFVYVTIKQEHMFFLERGGKKYK